VPVDDRKRHPVPVVDFLEVFDFRHLVPVAGKAAQHGRSGAFRPGAYALPD
jgi:hypothetical protein